VAALQMIARGEDDVSAFAVEVFAFDKGGLFFQRFHSLELGPALVVFGVSVIHHGGTENTEGARRFEISNLKFEI
jgi:hypothetical protein